MSHLIVSQSNPNKQGANAKNLPKTDALFKKQTIYLMDGVELRVFFTLINDFGFD